MLKLALIACAAILVSGLAAKPAFALTFQCVEPSRYKNLMPIFGDDPNLLFAHFGLQRRPLPDLNSCRALLVTGTLADGDADAVLERIIGGKGWLALLYVAFSGANIEEESRIALMVRAFALKTRAVRHPTYRYQPDFALRWEPPVSLAGTGAAPASARDNLSPLENGLKAYAQRRDLALPTDAKALCTDGCRTVFAGGVNRLYNSPPAGTAAPPEANPDAATMRTRAVLIQQIDLNRTPAADDPLLAKPLDWSGATPPATVRLLRERCSPEFSVAESLEERAGNAFTEVASNKFRSRAVEALGTHFEALIRGGIRLQQCLAAAHEGARLAAFQRHCAKGCDQAELSATFKKTAQEILEKASKL